MKKWEATFFRWFFTSASIIATYFVLTRPDFVAWILLMFCMGVTIVFWLGKWTGIEDELR